MKQLKFALVVLAVDSLAVPAAFAILICWRPSIDFHLRGAGEAGVAVFDNAGDMHYDRYTAGKGATYCTSTPPSARWRNEEN